MNRSHCWEAPTQPAHVGRVGRVRPAGLPEVGPSVDPPGCSDVEPPPVGGGQARCSRPGVGSQAEPVLSVTVTMLPSMERRAGNMAQDSGIPDEVQSSFR